MKETTSRLLAYSKEFFLSGERELEQNTNLAYMQAVLRFHDAVEYCVRAVIEELNVNHDRNADLLPLIKSINQSLDPKKLPLASQIDFLNTTRGKIKHHGSVPSLEDTQRCRLHARDFIEQVIRNFLNADFLSVSRLLLVANATVRQYLEAAEKKRSEGDYLESLILVKKAFYIARPSDQTVISKDSFFGGFFLTSGFREMRPLSQAMEKIVNKIGELEEHLASLMMGIDTLTLRRFQEITPRLSFFVGGGCSIHWDESIIPTDEMVKEGINYVIDMALLWDRKGVIGNRPELHPRRGYQPRRWRQVRHERWSYATANSPDSPSEIPESP
jgi:hypothetical protein